MGWSSFNSLNVGLPADEELAQPLGVPGLHDQRVDLAFNGEVRAFLGTCGGTSPMIQDNSSSGRDSSEAALRLLPDCKFLTTIFHTNAVKSNFGKTYRTLKYKTHSLSKI